MEDNASHLNMCSSMTIVKLVMLSHIKLKKIIQTSPESWLINQRYRNMVIKWKVQSSRQAVVTFSKAQELDINCSG